jgi:HAD superfamily hydrolase (TIGR01490 family)
MLKYLETHGRRTTARLYYASLLPSLLLRTLKLMPIDRFQQFFTVRLSWLVKGMDRQQGEAMFDWVAQEYLLPTGRSDTAERLHRHQAQGHTVAIVSAMFVPCLKSIAGHFGVKEFVGTQLEARDGRYTGRIVPPLISGAAKAEQARQLLSVRGDEIDWESSYAYGDSFTDRDMLSLVGHPVAVYPDTKLYALAKARNWEVLGTPK